MPVSAELVLQPINGPGRTVRQWLTTFHLLFVALDPYTNESAWILPTAARVLTVFQEADCRVAFLVAADAEDARRFLGPWAEEILTFIDPDRAAIKEFGLQRLPAIVHLGMDGTIVNSAEGWHPDEWERVTDHVARITSWIGPVLPGPHDPAPFEGTPAT